MKEKAVANALALITGLIYIVCAVLVAWLPDEFRLVANSWFHGMNLEVLWTPEPRENFLLGLFTASGGMWLVGWIYARLYNKFAK